LRTNEQPGRRGFATRRIPFFLPLEEAENRNGAPLFGKNGKKSEFIDKNDGKNLWVLKKNINFALAFGEMPKEFNKRK